MHRNLLHQSQYLDHKYSKYQSKKLRHCNGGYSLPLVLAAALILITGSAVLANRAGMGLLSAIFQNQSWEAREAAEIGMTNLISELNKERNRWLMVKRCEGETGDCEEMWTNGGEPNTTLRKNPCEPNILPEYSKLDPDNAASDSYGTWYIKNNGEISSSPTGANRAYKLMSVTRQTLNRSNIDRLTPFVERNNTQSISGTGTITLQVQGQSLQTDGSPKATATLEKSFDLVPKCCKVSFGGKHGGLNYGLDSESKSICTNNLLGLGLLAGAAQNNTGSITIKGRATEIEDGEGTPVDPVYCIASSQNGCNLDISGAVTNVAIIDAILPPAKTFPFEPDPSPGEIETSRISSTNSSDFLYKVTTRPPKPFTYYVVNGSSSSFPNHCRATSTEVHCNLSNLTYKNENLIFVTGTRKIRLYFPIAGASITNSGNGSMVHCLTINTNGNCSSEPTGSQITNLSLFGCQNCGDQTLTLRGTTSSLKLFAYFPQGSVTLAGDSEFEGLLWSNAISSLGNPTWIVPGSGVGSVFEYMDMIPSGNSETTTHNLVAYDFIARATNRYRWL